MKVILIGLLCLSLLSANSQDYVSISNAVRRSTIDDPLRSQLQLAVNNLYKSLLDDYPTALNNADEDQKLVLAVLNRYVFGYIRKEPERFLKGHIQNVYPVSTTQYMLSITGLSNSENPQLAYSFRLLASLEDSTFIFTNPIKYNSRHWKNSKVGTINYHYRDTLNIDRAMLFNLKNIEIASKLELKSEDFEFYMTENEQEVLLLLGIDYCENRDGFTRNGFGVYTNYICAIENNEDFSHDLFHYYSGKINETSNRNWVAEEAIAYLWGNAYYTDEDGEMISLNRMAQHLKQYLLKNSGSTVLELWESNEKIFQSLAPELSTTSVIGGILAYEVENRHGVSGLMKLINCGRKDRKAKFLTKSNELLGMSNISFENDFNRILIKYLKFE